MGSALAGPIHAAASRPLQPQENTEALLRGPLLHRRRLWSPSITSGGGIRTRDLRVMRSREGCRPDLDRPYASAGIASTARGRLARGMSTSANSPDAAVSAATTAIAPL